MKNEMLFKTVGNIDNWNIERPAPGRLARLGRVLVRYVVATVCVILVWAAVWAAVLRFFIPGDPADFLLRLGWI